MANTLPIKIGQAASRTVHPVLGDINGAIDGIKTFRFKAKQLGWHRLAGHSALAFVILMTLGLSFSQPAGRSTMEGDGLRPGRGKPKRVDLGSVAISPASQATVPATAPAGSALQPSAPTTPAPQPPDDGGIIELPPPLNEILPPIDPGPITDPVLP